MARITFVLVNHKLVTDPIHEITKDVTHESTLGLGRHVVIAPDVLISAQCQKDIVLDIFENSWDNGKNQNKNNGAKSKSDTAHDFLHLYLAFGLLVHAWIDLYKLSNE
jgi:hypothetical protein